MKLTDMIATLWETYDEQGDLDLLAVIVDDFDKTEVKCKTELIQRGRYFRIYVNTDTLDNRLSNATDRSGGTDGKGPEHDDLTIEKDL